MVEYKDGELIWEKEMPLILEAVQLPAKDIFMVDKTKRKKQSIIRCAVLR